MPRSLQMINDRGFFTSKGFDSFPACAECLYKFIISLESLGSAAGRMKNTPRLRSLPALLGSSPPYRQIYDELCPFSRLGKHFKGTAMILGDNKIGN